MEKGPRTGVSVDNCADASLRCCAVKLTLRLAFSIALGMSLITIVVGRYQISEEDRELRRDLEQQSALLADTLRDTIKPIIASGSIDQLQDLVERLGSRQKFAGLA